MSARYTLACLCVMAFIATPATARDKQTKAPPALYSQLSACRAIADSAQRLACFDAASAKLDAAIVANDLYMVDKAQVRETRRTLFGLPFPRLGLFGGGDDKDSADANEVTQIDSTVTSARANAEGWLITIAEGSTWQQTDDTALGLSPKPGMTVVVKRAALGSYRMNIGKLPSIKVKRVI
jgi:hypothetical protein